MATRYTSFFRSFENKSYFIEIHDSEFTGTLSSFNSGGDGFTIRYEPKDRVRHNSIIGSECAFQIDMATPGLESFITDLATASESRFTIKIRNPTAIFWAGTLTADVTKYPDQSPYFFEVRATDGLGSLSEIDYADASGNLYTGFIKITDLISRILRKINHVDVHYSSVEKLFETACDWWESRHNTSGTDKDPLFQTYVNNEVFITVKNKNEKTPMSCLEVLEAVLRPWGMRIVQTNGTFKIEQITYRAAGVGYYSRRYSRDGAYIDVLSLVDNNTINQTTSGALEATGVYEYLPPLKRVVVEFDTKSRRNLIDGLILNDTNTFGQFYSPIESNSGETNLRWSASISLNLKNDSYTGVPFEAVIFVWRMTLIVGDKTLKRTHSIQNFQINYGLAIWEDNGPTVWADELTPVFGIPEIGESAAFTFSTDITTPKLPLDGESYSIDFQLVSAKKYNGSSVFLGDFEITYSITNAWLEVYSYGAPELSEDAFEYPTSNPTAGNIVIEEFPVILGDGINPNAFGALRILEGGLYVRTVNWKESTIGTADKYLLQLLSKNILAGQATLIRKLNGSFFGDLDINRKYSWGSAIWLMLSGEWNAQTDTINGEFVEIKYAGGVTATTPKKIIKVVTGGGGANDPSSSPGGSNGLTQNTQFVAMPPATLMNSVASNGLATQVTSGAITTISLVETMGAGEYITGDEVTIVNPLTGQSETLTITADTTTGATSLSVSGTLSGNYPPGSYIIKKNQTGYKLNDLSRHTVTGVGTSIAVTVANASLLPRKGEHVKLVVGRLVYTTTEGDFTFSKSGLTFTLGSINADCSGLNGYVEWLY